MSEDREKRRFNLFRRKRKTQPETDKIIPQPADDPSEWLEALPDTDVQALQELAQISEEDVRPLVITPPEERFPPLNLAEASSSQVDTVVPDQKSPGENRRKNIITLLASVGILFLCVWFSIIWIDPQTPLNPLPPVTPFMIVTATSGGATPAEEPMQNSGAEQVIDAGFPFTLAPAGAIYAPNENGRGCEWLSIAGSIVGLDGAPLNGYSVRIQGPGGLDERVFSGVTQTFGEGGFELFLGGVPQAADYSVQLLTAQGAPLSDTFTVSTRADCDGNVVIVNFVQISDF